jgi:ABC-2 type transport system ATP-binding protein
VCDRVGVLSRGKLVAEGPPGQLRGSAERLRVEVDDLARARDALAGLEGIGVAVDGDRTLRVQLGRTATAAEVNAALVRAGVAVSALVPERESLEDVFLALVGDGDVQG